MISALAAAALLAGAAPDPNAELVAGKMPDEPARAVVQGKCVICHSADYVTQQRLTPAQWQKTVDPERGAVAVSGARLGVCRRRISAPG